MADPSIESALRYVGQSDKLTDADRAHLRRWLVEVENPVWEKIAADTWSYGELGNLVEGPYSYFIWSALRARANADKYAVSMPTRRLRNRQVQPRLQDERADLLALADDLDKVILRYQNCKPARAPRRPPPPDALTAPPSVQELEAKRSLDWLSREAQRLRRLAEREPKSEPDWDSYVPERISRQSGGKGKHEQSRQLGAFVRKMVNCLYRSCGQPRHRAVAVMTNIAFPTANVDDEYVRLRCRPTTRAGRRRKTGTPGR
jgi:hypothetical protein